MITATIIIVAYVLLLWGTLRLVANRGTISTPAAIKAPVGAAPTERIRTNSGVRARITSHGALEKVKVG